MKKRKWLSLHHWTRLFRMSWRYLASREVSAADKLLFVVPVALYWVLPDVLPFLPIDDIGVTMLLAGWFAERMERKYPALGSGRVRQ
ncbi:hypothetical protein [Paenibacillus tengchongensis]|uniref:hypothetical protein n=1 Tax=Paenibacillus tengchongensis TaxID=2608684 RepID=UPI00124C28B5|nr:hypothetical protein [Paenibacillus tengchongensis]